MERTRACILLLIALVTTLAGCANDNCLHTQGPGVAHYAPDGQGPYNIAYEAKGQGDFAVVLIHGWASNRTFLQEQFDGIDAPRTVAIDLIGHGESDAPDDPAATYTFDYMAGSIDAVLEELCIEQAVLVGHSNGVPTIREYYRMHPGKVAGLVMIDGTVRQMFDRDSIAMFTTPLQSNDYETFLTGFLDQMTSAPNALTARQIERIRAGMLATPRHVLIRAIEAQAEEGVFDDDPLNVPVLMINAKQPAWSADYTAYARTLIPDLSYTEWDGVTHFLHLERPDEFNTLVSDFVARVRAD